MSKNKNVYRGNSKPSSEFRVYRYISVSTKELARCLLQELDKKIKDNSVKIEGPADFATATAELLNRVYIEIKDELMSKIDEYVKEKNNDKEA